MASIFNTVVIRKDLGMTAGLLSAQACHIQDSFLRQKTLDQQEFSNLEKEWMKNPYLHVLAVANKEELEAVIADAKRAGLPVYEWRDLIPSENLKRSLPDVLVGCAIGPCDLDKVKAVAGTLPYA